MAPSLAFKCPGFQIAALVSDRVFGRSWPPTCSAREVLLMPAKGRLCVSGRLSAAPSPSGEPYSTYTALVRGGGAAAVVRLLIAYHKTMPRWSK